MSIRDLFYPRAMVLIGSVSAGKLGHELLRQILDGGYSEVSVVNPKGNGALGVPGYEAVTEIDRSLDLALVVSPTATVPGVLDDCGRAGVKAAIIITAGFSEVGNTDGEQEIKRVAQQYGIRFVGPNCAGILNTHHHLFPTLEVLPPVGQVSFVAQSGAVGGVILAWGVEYGLGFAKFVSYGNGVDLNETDFVHYLADDPETKVVALYIETVADGREFMEAVHSCTEHKPVVVVKAGRTQTGQRAALSHTGSMAGSDAVYDAALRECGAIRVRTLEEMFDLCMGFVDLPPLEGRRVVIVTNSGGPGVLAADHAEDVGLDVAEPSTQLQDALAEFLPPQCSVSNPIDLTVEGSEDGYRRTLLAVLQEYDAALALNIAPPYLDAVPLARGICDAAKQAGKPVMASFLPTQIVAKGIAWLEASGIPNFATGERAATALAHLAGYQASRTQRQALPAIPPGEKPLPGAGRLLEPEAMSWLRENGVPVPEFRFAETGAQAVQGCREIGYPVVMKVVSPQILHKSDTGGVILNINSDETASAAFEELEQVAAGREFCGVVIYPLIQGAQEVLLGLSRDPQFGPVVVCGLGGIYTEIWHDISLRVAPVDRAQADAMLRELQSFPLLKGTRGQAGGDLNALGDLLVTFSRLPFLYPEIVEVDLNPVFLFPKGLVVGDVRVIAGDMQANDREST